MLQCVLLEPNTITQAESDEIMLEQADSSNMSHRGTRTESFMCSGSRPSIMQCAQYAIIRRVWDFKKHEGELRFKIACRGHIERNKCASIDTSNFIPVLSLRSPVGFAIILGTRRPTRSQHRALASWDSTYHLVAQSPAAESMIVFLWWNCLRDSLLKSGQVFGHGRTIELKEAFLVLR